MLVYENQRNALSNILLSKYAYIFVSVIPHLSPFYSCLHRNTILYTFAITVEKLAGNSLNSFCKVSVKLLRSFCKASVKLLPSFYQASAKLLPSFCQASVKLLSSFCQASAKLLPSSCQASAKLLSSQQP